MYKSFIFTFCFLFSVINLFASDETANISAFNVSSSYSDCNDISGTISASAHYHWFFTCDIKTYKWNGSSWDVLSGNISIGFDFPYDGDQHYWSVSNEAFQADNVLSNGTYQFRAALWVQDTDDSDVKTFTVTDNTAPATPINVATSWSSNHPHLSWSANSEIDLHHYEIWKKRGASSWELFATTTNTSITDDTEIKYSLPGSKEYIYYKLSAVDHEDNSSSFTTDFQFAVNQWQQNMISYTETVNVNLAIFSLGKNYPNPFNPETKISFGFPEQSSVSLDVYDVAGKKVAELVTGVQEAGLYTTTFNAHSLPSGVYIYKMTAKGLQSGKSFTDFKRMLLIK
ncbi:MAG: T9SS type A sorting domain-containing protein [Calditrichae bacterium]|nr:T9SS type A sorting domain-containing protein [Calditrichota bacterium]MCB9059729.1 T9SS type A sorting domain-containing protein [Calditrichia bacterium]